MKVTLLASTPNATKVVATAAWICTHLELPTEADLHPDKCGPMVKRVVGYGHTSILEHASFTFAIEGISRACSHQLVRYRIASFSQQSQRFVKFGNGSGCGYVMPESCKQDVEVIEEFERALIAAEAAYAFMTKKGIPAEDARFVLPSATTTKLVMTMNARELLHFFQQRLCIKAQWEIRALAEAIHDICQHKDPVLFQECGPDCFQCREKAPCARGSKLQKEKRSCQGE
jgi:thymidylate synthase (FAD)